MKTISNLILCAIVAVIVKQITPEYLLVKISNGTEKGKFFYFYHILIEWGNLRIIDIKFYCFFFFITVDVKKFSSLKAQPRSFDGPILVKHDPIAWRECKNAHLQRKVEESNKETQYYIKRDPVGNNKGKFYTYYVVINENDGKNQRLSEAVGRKRGSCRIGETRQIGDDTNQNCGFEIQLLIACFQDRGLKNKRTNEKKGFDPRLAHGWEKHPKWNKDREFAKTAHEACDRMVHFQIQPTINFDDPEDIRNPKIRTQLMNIAYAFAAAQDAHCKTTFFTPFSKRGLNIVFSNRKKGVVNSMMLKEKVATFQQLFPKDQYALDNLMGDNMNNLLKRINDLYFCQIAEDDPAIEGLLEERDDETINLMNAVLAQRPNIPPIASTSRCNIR